MTANGSVKAGTDAELTAQNGDMTVGGTVTAGTDVTATAGGSFTNTAEVAAGRNATIAAGDAVTLDEAVTATAGKVSATATNGALQVTANGSVKAGTDAELTAKKGNVALDGAVSAGNDATLSAGRNLTANAVLKAGNDATIAANGGTLETTAKGTVSAGRNAQLSSSRDTSLYGTVTAGGGVTADAGGTFANNAAMTAKTGNVTVSAAKGATLAAKTEATKGTVAVTAANGALQVTGKGSVKAGTDAELTARKGNSTLNGSVSAKRDVVVSAGGKLTANAAVKAASGNAALQAGKALSVTSAGSVTGGKNVLLLSEQGNVQVGKQAAVTAGKDLVVLAEAGTVSFGEQAEASAAGNAVLRAKGNIALSTMTLTARSLGLQSASGSVLDTKADIEAKDTMLIVAGKDVMLKGKSTASSLGIHSSGDITLGNLDVAKFAADSTAGSVTVNAARNVELANLSGAAATAEVQAERADGGSATVRGTQAGGGLNGIQAKKDVTFTGKNVSGTQIVSGGKTTVRADAVGVRTISADGDFDLQASSVDSGSIRAGGSIDADVGGRMKVDALTAGRDIRLAKVGGDLVAETVSAKGAFDAETGGDATLTEAEIGGTATMQVGGTLQFDTLRAKDAEIHAGSVRMGELTAGKAVIEANRNIDDNGSMVSVDTLTMTAGGDIGSASNPINTDVRSKIEKIAGRNVYLLEHANGHPVKLGVIEASGHLSLSAPWIGGADGESGFTDDNGDALNIAAGDGFELNLGGKLGSADNPVEAQIHGKTGGSWIIRNGELTGTDPSYVYIVIGGEGTDYDYTPVYKGTNAIPGLVIVKGRPVLGHPDLLRKIYSALAFSVDTPELKSTQGVFGSPLFLHTDLALFNAGETGVDYWSVVNNSLFRPNILQNAIEFRHWHLEAALWSPLRLARSEAYLKRFAAAPKAEKKSATRAEDAADGEKSSRTDGK